MKLNNKKGISLIVLVITIIVMIVLAAAIILSLSNSGVIGRANEAKSKTDVANAKQVVAMATAEWQLDEAKIRKEDTSIQSLKDYANKKLEDAGFTTSGNGGISLSDSGAVNTIYIDSKGKQAIIPEGFAVSQLITEKTVEDGLVIKDEKGNEFVWVPVEVPADKTFEEVFRRKTVSDYAEPFSTDSYTEEVEEHNIMKASVEKNGGFYIARYEAGKEKNNVNTVVSKKSVDVWNNILWSQSMSMTEIGTDGAIYYSRQMYKASNSVTSTLCYGVQWDAVMNFMDGVPNVLDNSKDYIDDSTGMGWYGDNSNYEVHKTGTDVDEKASNMVKNIYDMAGNVAEWTMEAVYTDRRVLRGGDYQRYGDNCPASERLEPMGNIDPFGFRVALYLK